MKVYEITNRDGKVFCEKNYNEYHVGDNFVAVKEKIEYKLEIIKGIFKKRKEYIDATKYRNVLSIPIIDIYSIKYVELKENK